MRAPLNWLRRRLNARADRAVADRIDKFSARAFEALSFARAEAQRLNHNYVGTEHLLLGLLSVPDGVACRVLTNLGVNLDQVKQSVDFIIGRGDRMVLGEAGLTPRAKKVIELAVDEARHLGHRHIGAEHLLLGLIREGEGIAAGVLESLGVRLGQVREEVLLFLSDSQTSESPGAGAEPASSPRPTGQPTAYLVAQPRIPSRLLAPLDYWLAGVRRVERQARALAIERGDRVIGTEHLLVAVAFDRDGEVGEALHELAVEPEAIDAAFRRLDRPANEDEGFTFGARRVLEHAISFANRREHPTVRPGHILLALLDTDAEGAPRIFAELDVDREALRSAIEIRIARDAQPDPPSA